MSRGPFFCWQPSLCKNLAILPKLLSHMMHSIYFGLTKKGHGQFGPLCSRIRKSLLAPYNYTFQLSKHTYNTRIFASLPTWDFTHFLYYSHFNWCILSINFSLTQTPIWTHEYITSIYSWDRTWFYIDMSFIQSESHSNSCSK